MLFNLIKIGSILEIKGSLSSLSEGALRGALECPPSISYLYESNGVYSVIRSLTTHSPSRRLGGQGADDGINTITTLLVEKESKKRKIRSRAYKEFLFSWNENKNKNLNRGRLNAIAFKLYSAIMPFSQNENGSAYHGIAMRSQS